MESTLSLVAEGGPGLATVSNIARRTGAPIGSIYHRYRSRKLLLADLWLTVVERFQEGLLDEMRKPDPLDASVSAALHSAAWVRSNLIEARLLLLHRREDIVRGDWPKEMSERASSLAEKLDVGICVLTRRLFGRAGEANLMRVRFAVLYVPYGAIRPYLEVGTAPPLAVDGLLRKTCEALLTH